MKAAVPPLREGRASAATKAEASERVGCGRPWLLTSPGVEIRVPGKGHGFLPGTGPRADQPRPSDWCRVVWRCRQDRTPYDPARHRALQQHVLVTVPTPSGSLPDLAATRRMLGAAVTDTAARRAECEALDGKPTSAGALGG